MHHRFAGISLFRQLLTDWEVHGGIRRSHKVRAIVVVLLCSGGTLCFGNLSPTLSGLMFAFISVGIFVILKVPLVLDAE